MRESKAKIMENLDFQSKGYGDLKSRVELLEKRVSVMEAADPSQRNFISPLFAGFEYERLDATGSRRKVLRPGSAFDGLCKVSTLKLIQIMTCGPICSCRAQKNLQDDVACLK